MKEISHFPLKLPVDKIKRRLKMPIQAKNKNYDSLIENFFALVEPWARFVDMEMFIQNGKIVFEDGYKINSDSLKKHLKDCLRVSLLGVTIGGYIEEEMKKYQIKGKNLEPLILDAVGSECVEEAAIFVTGQIHEEIMRKAFSPTKRFSPGYSNLSLDVQRYFFEKLKLEEIGIKLNSSLLMIPQKSITAFIGWRKKKV